MYSCNYYTVWDGHVLVKEEKQVNWSYLSFGGRDWGIT